MATDRTRRLVGVQEESTKLSAALRGRRRLQEEAIKLHRERLIIEKRLSEIDDEEELWAAEIDRAGGVVAAANDGPKEGDE